MPLKNTLESEYKKYLETYNDFWKRSVFFETIPKDKFTYKSENLKLFNRAISEKDRELLDFCVDVSYYDGIDRDYAELVNGVLLERWHDKQEDIVNSVYLKFPYPIFTDALLEIAIKRKVYRRYDHETEATLRKCVHALIAIGTPDADVALGKIKSLKNENVEAVLEMYK